jgi:hypothetical protein
VQSTKSPGGRIVFSAVLMILALALAPAALAGKGGGGGKKGGGTTGGATLSVSLVSDVNANGQPNWGDTVTFTFSQTATTEPHVDLTCSQNRTVVYSASSGFYASYPWPWTQNMTLSSQSWSAGSASCTARLYSFSGSSTVTLSTLSFTAGA